MVSPTHPTVCPLRAPGNGSSVGVNVSPSALYVARVQFPTVGKYFKGFFPE